MCDMYDLQVNQNNKRAGNLSCLTLAREIFKREALEMVQRECIIHNVYHKMSEKDLLDAIIRS